MINLSKWAHCWTCLRAKQKNSLLIFFLHHPSCLRCQLFSKDYAFITDTELLEEESNKVKCISINCASSVQVHLAKVCYWNVLFMGWNQRFAHFRDFTDAVNNNCVILPSLHCKHSISLFHLLLGVCFHSIVFVPSGKLPWWANFASGHGICVGSLPHTCGCHNLH